MLSAIVKYLPLIREEHIMERRQMLVDVCVSAYPDLCPWQVKQALIEFTPAEGSVVPKGLKDELKDLYYYYLSSLLHPQDGHEAARHDKSLVEVRFHAISGTLQNPFIKTNQLSCFVRNGAFYLWRVNAKSPQRGTTSFLSLHVIQAIILPMFEISLCSSG